MQFSSQPQSINFPPTPVLAWVGFGGGNPDYLRQCLRSLGQQTVLPARIVVAANATQVETIRAIWEKLQTDYQAKMPNHKTPILEVVGVDKARNLGQLLTGALSKIDFDPQDYPYWWILHADTIAAPDCLEQLIFRLETSKSIGAVGPKHLGTENPKSASQALVSVGIRATRLLRRVPDVAPEEIDQGQIDERRQVIGLSSAGMLIRQEVWQAVGGFSSVLGPFSDGLEFSLRIWRWGWRVEVCPNAKMVHYRQQYSPEPVKTFRKRRFSQIYSAVLHAPAFCAVFIFLAYFGLAPLRAIARLASRHFYLAADELLAFAQVVMHLPNLLVARMRMWKAGKVWRPNLYGLVASGKELRQERARVRRVVSGPHWTMRLSDLQWAARQADLRVSSRVRRVVLPLTVGFWALFIHQAKTHGYLAAALGDYTNWPSLSGYLPVGDGYFGWPDLAAWPLALIGKISALLGQGHLAGVFAIFLYAIWAALGMSVLSGALTRKFGPRLVFSLGYVFSPILLSPGLNGQVHLLAALAWLPWVIWAALRATGMAVRDEWQSNRPSLRMLCLTAFFSAVAVSHAPILYPFILAGGVWAGFAGILTLWRSVWLVLVTSVAVAPTLVSSIINPGQWTLWFNTPDTPIKTLPANPLELISFSPDASLFTFIGGAKWIFTTIAVLWLLLAIVNLASPRCTGMYRLAIWWLSILLVGMVILPRFIVVGLSQLGSPAVVNSPIAAIFLALWWLLLGVQVVQILPVLSWTRIVTWVSGGLPLIAVGATVVFLSLSGIHAEDSEYPQLPRLLAAAQENSRQERTIILNVQAVGGKTGQTFVQAQVWRADGRQITNRNTSFGIWPSNNLDVADQHLRSAVALLVSGQDDGIAVQQLAEHAIGSVVLLPVASGKSASETLQTERARVESALQAAVNLQVLSKDAAGTVYRLTQPRNLPATQIRALTPERPARLYTVEINRDGQSSQAKPVDLPTKQLFPSNQASLRANLPAEQGGLLILAERANPHWRAYLNGVPLAPVKLTQTGGLQNSGDGSETLVDTWQQIFELPSGGGSLEIEFLDPWRYLHYAQYAFLLVAALIAVPLRNREEEVLGFA